MRNRVLFLMALFAAVVTNEAADLTGKVVLKGTPKPEITIDMAADPKCGAMHPTPATTRHYVVGEGSGLANVLVFVKSGLSAGEFPAPTDAPLVDQIKCEYVPYVIGLRTNQKLKIKNSDATLHNVHATPKPGGANKEFNFAQPVKDMVSEKTFPASEVAIRFKCDVHPWMFAYVGVFDHPYFAVTDKDGNFKIAGLPNGKYVLEAWHPKTHGTGSPGMTQEIAVEGDKKADFTIELK